MKFNVTEVEFDFTDSQGSISFDEIMVMFGVLEEGEHWNEDVY